MVNINHSKIKQHNVQNSQLKFYLFSGKAGFDQSTNAQHGVLKVSM